MEAVASETWRCSDLLRRFRSIPVCFERVDDDLLLREGSVFFLFGSVEVDVWILHDSSQACVTLLMSLISNSSRLASGRCCWAIESLAIDE